MVPIVAALLEAGLGILGGAVASKGKDLIEDKLGINIEKMLTSNEGKIELLKAQTAYEEMLNKYILENKKLATESDKLLQTNTDGARAMQIAALAQDDIFSKRFIYVYSSIWSLFSMIYIGAISFAPIPDNSIRFVDTILGFLLGTIVATLLNFFFGSSKQSQVKDSTIQEAIKGLKQ